MSHKLIDLNEVLSKLVREDYKIEITDGQLFVHHVPYLNSNKDFSLGTLIMPIETSGDIVLRPSSHTAKWAGEFPNNIKGEKLPSLENSEINENVGNGIYANFFFSCHPEDPKGYKDFYEKVKTYYLYISSPARELYPEKFKRAKTMDLKENNDSSLVYDDTNASRAQIVGINEILKNQKIAIIGLGGTGSYVLDYLAKCPVAEIHLFDKDFFNTHNAFRSPGAPSVETLRKQPFKVDYFASVYKNMHKHIIPHVDEITCSNIENLKSFTFVFVCIDNAEIRKQIADRLIGLNIPFVDSGIGVENSNNQLCGLIRVTTGMEGHYNHLNHSLNCGIEEENNEYSTNIQIAELNSLAAVLSIIKWKRMSGFYTDTTNKDFSFVYSIANNVIISNES